MAWKYKITWQTGTERHLDKDDDPAYFERYRDALNCMKDIIWEIQHSRYMSSDRQVVKMYWGGRLVDAYDSMPRAIRGSREE